MPKARSPRSPRGVLTGARLRMPTCDEAPAAVSYYGVCGRGFGGTASYSAVVSATREANRGNLAVYPTLKPATAAVSVTVDLPGGGGARCERLGRDRS